MGLPAVVGTEDATSVLKNGHQITVSCAEGETGFVYDGKLDYTVEKTDLTTITKPKRTHIMMNIANPDGVFRLSFLPNEGVGLARLEFIVSNFVKIHPLALLSFDRVSDEKVKAEIREMTANYENKGDYFVERLAEGVSMIAAAFYPKPVILRFSDFKTNEYANLIGGADFEPKEENPM